MAGTTNKAWFLYLLRCADGSLYTGITNNVPRRCKQHNAGTASRYTRSRLPVELIYQELHASRSVALKRESAIKAMSRQEKELLIQSVRKTATKFAHLRKIKEKNKVVRAVRKKK
jgi:predicted GIY-YIG superfamily endonuclease